MTQLHRKTIQSSHGTRAPRRISSLRRCILRVMHTYLFCGRSKSSMYLMLSHDRLPEPSPVGVPSDKASCELRQVSPSASHTHELDSDLVTLKISLLGDCRIGKTSFLEKYAGHEKAQEGKQNKGLNQRDKTLDVNGARISYSIWEVGGDGKSQDQISLACNDSVAILIMFDLTSRCTLNSVLDWYKEARKYNQTAIPVLVGTKFDDFIQLPIDLQWTIANQARTYAKALNATLFFSSATYNINVNKIFKFITAKLFDLPWRLERNLNIGEPTIDF